MFSLSALEDDFKSLLYCSILSQNPTLPPLLKGDVLYLRVKTYCIINILNFKSQALNQIVQGKHQITNE